MKANLILAAVEYFSDRGNTWTVARVNAAITVALYLYLNAFTFIGFHYAVSGNLLAPVVGMNRTLLAGGITIVGVAAWALSPSKRIDDANAEIAERTVRRAVFKIYCITSLVLFFASVGLALARMS